MLTKGGLQLYIEEHSLNKWHFVFSADKEVYPTDHVLPPMVPLPPMLGSLDGMLLKCEKAKFMNHFTKAQDAPNPPPPGITMIWIV